MDDPRYPGAIRHAFERFTVSAEASFPAERSSRTGRQTAPGIGRLQRLALPVAAAAIAAVVGVVALAPARPAFASWSAVPSSAAPAAVSTAEDTCKLSEPELAGLQVTGSEQRGAYTVLLFTDAADRSFGLCVTGDGMVPLVLAGAAPSSGMVDAPVTDDRPMPPAGTDHEAPDWADLPPVHYVAMPAVEGPATQQVQAFVMGISGEVARLEVERSGAEPAVATLADAGIAFVWWPSGPLAGDIVAYDADGNVLDRLPADMLSPH